MKRIIITGGLGFIGHNVTRTLESQGHDVYVLDNMTDYGFIPKKELKFLVEHRKKRIKARPIPIDICNVDRINNIFSAVKPDMVIHLASFPRQKIVNKDPVLGSKVMSTGLINLLEECKLHDVQKFVYISSSMVYGDFTSTCQSEDAACNPQGQYGIMKLAGEWLVKDYARTTGMDYTIIRPSAVYGEWDVNDRVVSKFMASAMRGEMLKVNGPDEVLDFTYVEDTAQGIVQAALSPTANGGTYNITRSGDKDYTLLDAAVLAVKIAGRGDIEVADRDLDFPSRGRLSIDRARADFNYNPTVDVEEGFQRYHEWFTQNPVLWHR